MRRTPRGWSGLDLKGDPLLRQGGVLTLGMLLLHAANWLYHVFMSRALGPVDYGAVSAVLGLLLLFTVPAHAIQMGMSAVVAGHRGRAAEDWTGVGDWLKGALAFGAAASALLIVLSPWVSRLLGLTNPAMVVGAAVLIPWSVLPFLRGWLQGHQRTTALGVSLTTEGVVKLAVAVLLVRMGLGMVGAVGGVTLGALAALLLTLPVLRWARPEMGEGARRPESLAVALAPYLFAVGAFSVLTQADVVLVKAIFPAHQAGLYAAASTAGKIVLYVTAPLSMVMLPEAVRREARSIEGRSVLIRGVRYAGLAGGAVAALYLVAPGPLIRILFGPAYVGAAPLLPWLGVGMLAFELALLGIYYRLGAGDRGGLAWIAVPAVLFPALVLAVGQSVLAVAMVVVALGVSTCAVVWWRLWPQLRGPSRRARAGARDATD